MISALSWLVVDQGSVGCLIGSIKLRVPAEGHGAKQVDDDRDDNQTATKTRQRTGIDGQEQD
jgi:hypothetical protein